MSKIDSFNQSKKQCLIDEMKMTLELQKEERKMKELVLKVSDKKYDTIIKTQFDQFNKEKQLQEMTKRDKIRAYKEELDKQLVEKEKLKPNAILGII